MRDIGFQTFMIIIIIALLMYSLGAQYIKT
jgi:hypothetical protein